MARTIDLEERKQFRVLLNPVRQDIIHLLRRAGRPMTANTVAEKMLLSPSAAQSHLNKLEELGVVELGVCTAPDGRQATYYRLADVEIRLCLGRKDGFQGEREALAAQLVDGTFRGVLHAASQCGEPEQQEDLQFLFGALRSKPEERAELLARMDLAEDALDDKPACPLCGDTGWRGTEMCRCLRALCAQEQIRELSKLLDLGEQSFDTFRMDYYSTSFWPEWGTSPRENMELVYEVCLNYAQKFGRFYFKNLFLSGAPGWARPSCLPASPALCRRTDIRWCMTQRGTCSRSSRPGSSSGTATTAGRPGTRPGAIWAVTC